MREWHQAKEIGGNANPSSGVTEQNRVAINGLPPVFPYQQINALLSCVIQKLEK